MLVELNFRGVGVFFIYTQQNKQTAPGFAFVGLLFIVNRHNCHLIPRLGIVSVGGIIGFRVAKNNWAYISDKVGHWK